MNLSPKQIMFHQFAFIKDTKKNANLVLHLFQNRAVASLYCVFGLYLVYMLLRCYKNKTLIQFFIQLSPKLQLLVELDILFPAVVMRVELHETCLVERSIWFDIFKITNLNLVYVYSY